MHVLSYAGAGASTHHNRKLWRMAWASVAAACLMFLSHASACMEDAYASGVPPVSLHGAEPGPGLSAPSRALLSSAAANQAPLFGCPLRQHYHSWKPSGEAQRLERLPYLLGGLFQRSDCHNCQRDGFWTRFCGWKPGSTGSQWWDFQKCSPRTVRAAIEYISRHGDGLPLALTPCDLYDQIQGRTLWVVG